MNKLNELKSKTHADTKEVCAALVDILFPGNPKISKASELEKELLKCNRDELLSVLLECLNERAEYGQEDHDSVAWAFENLTSFLAELLEVLDESRDGDCDDCDDEWDDEWDDEDDTPFKNTLTIIHPNGEKTTLVASGPINVNLSFT